MHTCAYIKTCLSFLIMVQIRVRRVRKQNVSFQSKMKRNEISFKSVSHAHVKNMFLLLFAFFWVEFFACNQSEINTSYFCFVSLQRIFCFALFRFKAKRNERFFTFFRFEAKQNKVFCFFSLH
jgi:Na+/H+ antiporter NhaD/arsenite permease-like protein